MAYPFATPSRIPPRVLDPLLVAHREASARLGIARPLPAIECNGFGPVKRIVATSDIVTGTILACIADELDHGEIELLSTEPWLHLHYGIVSLRGRPWTQAAETLRELVVQAERAATTLGERLHERHSPETRRRRRESHTTKKPAGKCKAVHRK